MQGRVLAAVSVVLVGGVAAAWRAPGGISISQVRPVWNGHVTYGKETKGQYVTETIRIEADYQLSDSGLPLMGSVKR